MTEAVTGLVRRAVRTQILAFLAVLVACGTMLGSELPPVLLAIGIWGIAGVGLGLVLGFAGQISLCQAAFVGVGAYAYAIATTEFTLPTVVALMCGALVAGALAAVVSPILKIQGYYLAIATIVLSLLLSALALSGIGVPGGASGLGGVPYLELFGFEIDTIDGYAYLSLILLLAFTVGAHLRYGRGRRWRAIQALRQDEGLAGGMGINVFGIKRELFTVSGAAAGLAGGILAAAFGFISPAQFSFTESFTLALAVFIGGSYSLWGAVLGVALLEVSGPLLGDAHALHGLLVGAAALITVRFAPQGWIRRRGHTEGAHVEDIAPLERTGGHEHVGRGGATLTASGLGISFGALRAVHDVDLDITPGKVVGLIGPNGAGKSTLLNLVAGELTATSGTVHLDGRDITGTSAFRRSRLGMARTYQQSRIVTGLSVLDNILLGTDSVASGGVGHHSSERERALAVEAARDAGAVHLLAKPTDSLTFGERRLVELARLLVSDPRIALLDEPCSGLSQTEGDVLSKVIRLLRDRGTAVVLVEHAIPFVLPLADELVVLREGTLLAVGTPEQVVALESVRESYLGTVLEEEKS